VKTKVYYADTDAGGVVYYANYLRWMEMARCDLLEELGTSVAEHARQGHIFAVARVEIDYLQPALLGDEVGVETSVLQVRRVRFTVQQRVVRTGDAADLAVAKITLACVDAGGKLQGLPDTLAAALRERTV
jgi:acyl-CoA thioester hydrolase